MNMDQRGWTNVKVKMPNINRLNKIAVTSEEPYNSVITRIIDYWEKGHGSNTK